MLRLSLGVRVRVRVTLTMETHSCRLRLGLVLVSGEALKHCASLPSAVPSVRGPFWITKACSGRLQGWVVAAQTQVWLSHRHANVKRSVQILLSMHFHQVFGCFKSAGYRKSHSERKRRQSLVRRAQPEMPTVFPFVFRVSSGVSEKLPVAALRASS